MVDSIGDQGTISTGYRYAHGFGTRKRGDVQVYMLWLVLAVAGVLWGASNMTVPYYERGSGSTNNTNGTNQTSPSQPCNLTDSVQPPHPECDSTNWSAGSAFFTIVALCFGYYSHPRGSLIAARSGRTWRLSPILAAEETVVIISMYIYARLKGKGSSPICYAILASRLVNGFHPSELKEVLGLSLDPPPTDDLMEVYRLMRASRVGTQSTGEVDQGPQDGSVAEQTSVEPQESTDEQSETVRRQDIQSPGVEGTISTQTSSNGADADLDMHVLPSSNPEPMDADVEAQIYLAKYTATEALVAKHRLDYNIHLFKGLFRYIQDLDAGPSYRIFVWLPMLLQVFKLAAVFFHPQRISRLTYLIAFTYFLSWLVVELVMITAAQNELTYDETEEGVRLCHVWRQDFLSFVSAEKKFDKPDAVISLGVPSLATAIIVNIYLTGKFVFDGGLPYIPNMWAATAVFLCICIATIIVSSCCMVPIFLFLVYGVVSAIWKCSRAERYFGKPQILRGKPDQASLHAASVAIFSAVLAFLAFRGVGPWKDSFPCWTMKQPSFYDWLG